LPEDKTKMLHAAAVKACDGLDGTADGLIQDPARCRFDPVVLQCKGDAADGCLMAEQVAAARELYAPVVHPGTKKLIYPGLAPGSELGWGEVAGPVPQRNGVDALKNAVFQNPAWDFSQFDLNSFPEATAKVGTGNNPLNADLRAYFKKGGKLLLYHGWNDTVVAPGSSIHFYQSVLRKVGKGSKAADAVRLFLVPGMAHCRGGEGPNDFDDLGALTAWVEQGKAPESMLASHVTGGKVDRTRPVCAYPQVAVYKGSGSIDEAANFACRMPPPE
jgi:feruloyl esterase